MFIKKIIYLFTLTLVCLSNSLIAQYLQVAPIPSSTYFVDTIGVNGINIACTPPINISALKSEYDNLALMTGLDYYGSGIPVSMDIKQMGTHQQSQYGDLYRLKVAVPGAFGLQFVFDQFNLPSGAILYFYNPEKTV